MVMPSTNLVSVGVACLFGISAEARCECKGKALRVKEFRLASAVRPDAEANSEKEPFSHYTVGKLVAQLIASAKRGEVVRVRDQQLKAESIRK